MKRNKGITLIALVITIIILLILAGITIASILSDNGFINRAKQAKNNTLDAQNEENKIMEDYEEKINSIADNTNSQEDIIEIGDKFEITPTNINIVLTNLENTKQEKIRVTKVPLKEYIKSKIIWKSSDNNIVEVNQQGTITAKNKGTATITATIENTDISQICTVNISIANNTIEGEKNPETGEVRLNLEKYIDEAKDGDTIYIPAGEYVLDPIKTTLPYLVPGGTQTGIQDKGKRLEFVGENEQTRIIYYGKDATSAQSHAVQFINSNSILRNLIYEFHPNPDRNLSSENNIFTHSTGKVSNVYFDIRNDSKVGYAYTNHSYQNMDITNCTFRFNDLSKVIGDYGTHPTRYTNILTNYTPPVGTKNNILLKKELQQDIQTTKEDLDVIENQVGVYFGQYAWK